MSRRSNHQYLLDHRNLRLAWQRWPWLYAYLPYRQQRALHDYFRPSKDWSDHQLLTHRTAISAERSSLPQQAGKAVEAFKRMVRTQRSASVGTPKRGRPQRIKVHGLANPDIDMKKLARALLMLAEQQMEERKAKEKDASDKAA